MNWVPLSVTITRGSPKRHMINSHVRETTTTAQTLVSSQNPDVDNLEEKSVRIISDPAGIVQAAKLRKQADIEESGDESNYLKNGKLEQVVAIIKSRTLNALGDLTMTLKDLSVFSPKPSFHYLNITMRNLVKVFPKETVPRNGSSVGGSGMLDKEEIIKMLEEEEMVELELQVGKNVTDQEEHQLRLDEEALILALEEEREATAEQ
ncbi:ribonuclease H-like domain-containing protein [Tanacetum coccineum]